MTDKMDLLIFTSTSTPGDTIDTEAEHSELHRGTIENRVLNPLEDAVEELKGFYEVNQAMNIAEFHEAYFSNTPDIILYNRVDQQSQLLQPIFDNHVERILQETIIQTPVLALLPKAPEFCAREVSEKDQRGLNQKYDHQRRKHMEKLSDAGVQILDDVEIMPEGNVNYRILTEHIKKSISEY